MGDAVPVKDWLPLNQELVQRDRPGLLRLDLLQSA
jgi:hypothetical protein